jgi:hypothetical protein
VIIILNGRIAVDSMLSDLQKDNHITLSVKEDVSSVKSALSAVEGISSISPLTTTDDGVHRYSLEASRPVDEVAPLVASQVIARGMALYGLNAERRNLETVFREVNRGA